MKNKFYSLFIFFVLTALAGCNEKESTDVIEQGDPQIIEFTPTSGKFGQEITIKGEFLRDIQKATIGGVEATIRYKLSQQEIVIVVPANAGNGKILLSTKEKKTESEQSFTIVYPVPQVKNVPAGAHVGDQIEIQGENLDIVSKVCFNSFFASCILLKSITSYCFIYTFTTLIVYIPIFYFIGDFIEISYEMKKLPITFSTPANSMTMIGSFFFLNKRYIQMIKIPPCIQLIC